MNDWRSRLLAAVSPLESGVRGLQVNGYRRPDGEAYRPSRTAAVLVAFLDLPEPELILTRRAEHLLQHPGQICFPGGAAEDNDRTAVQTALREAEEEIGLPPQVARPIGFLDRMDTISDYRVLPVVALVTPPVDWVLDRSEVAEVFTVPASVALDRRTLPGPRAGPRRPSLHGVVTALGRVRHLGRDGVHAAESHRQDRTVGPARTQTRTQARA
jgi:8-oxo-dGTP pyrophosphatase MutT (NUDIX family)